MSSHQSLSDFGNQSEFINPQEARDFLQHAPIGIFKTSPEGRYLYANQTLAQMYGYGSPQELMDSITDITNQVYADPQDRAKLLQQLDAYGQVENFESRILRRDGTIFWSSQNVQAVRDDTGKIVCFHGFVTDISARKHVEEELQQRKLELEEQKTLYSSLVEDHPYFVERFLPDTTIIFANQALAEYTGCSPEQLKGERWIEFVPYEERKYILEQLAGLSPEDPIRSFENSIPDQDGKLRWGEWTNRAFFNEQGEIKYFQSVGADITQRKQAEEALRYQKHLLETIINGTWDILSIKHPDYTVECYNQAGYDLLGLAAEEVDGRKCFELIGRDQICRPCATHQTLESKEPVNIEKYDSELGLHLDCRSSPVLDDKGNIVRIVEHLRNISEQKNYEARLKSERDYIFQLFHSMSQFVFVVSQHYRLEFLNRSAKEYFGDFTGCICYEQLQRNTPCTQCPIPQILSNDSFESVRHCNKIFGRLLEGNATKLINPDGTVSVLHVLEDITEQEEMKKALLQSKNYYQTIFETSGTAMFIIEEDTTISHANSNFVAKSGYSKQEIEGKKSWTEFVHPDDLEWMKENHFLRRRDPRAAPINYEFRFLFRNGEAHHGYLTIGMIPGTTQSVVSLIDINERKRTEKILQARLRLMEYSLTHSFEEALTATIDEAENLTDSRIGFYHFLQSDQRTISLQAWSTQTNTQACFAHGKGMHYDLDQAGVWVDCIRKGEPVIHNDYSSLPHRKGTPQGHPSIVRELLVPVYRGDTIKALLGVGNKPGNYTNADIEAVSLLANLAWDITERKQMEEKLKRMSLHDSLTGLYNRNFFEEEMKRLSDGRHNPLGIIVCDVNGLKFINDTLGHQSGDQVLISVAGILRQSFRSSDIIARIGGDEFAVLLTDTDPEVVEVMLQRLCQAVLDFNSTEPEIPVSLSMGYALGEGTTFDMQALFREADNRMYREKIQREGSTRSVILQAITQTMKSRDFDTEGHCDRLQKLAISFAHSLDLAQDLVNDISLLARFHDLGKVGIPDHILFKPGPLTEEEWQQMRQ
ncbi:MAG: PAS domain S-box protein, partial [Desulfovermiculus sp.]